MELVISRILRWPLKSLPIPVSVHLSGQNLLLTNKIWQRLKDFGDAIKSVLDRKEIILGDSDLIWKSCQDFPDRESKQQVLFPASLKAAVVTWIAYGLRNSQVAKGLSSTASNNWIFSATWWVWKTTPSSRCHSSGDNLITVLWHLGQRTQLRFAQTVDPYILWDNKSMLLNW